MEAFQLAARLPGIFFSKKMGLLPFLPVFGFFVCFLSFVSRGALFQRELCHVAQPPAAAPWLQGKGHNLVLPLPKLSCTQAFQIYRDGGVTRSISWVFLVLFLHPNLLQAIRLYPIFSPFSVVLGCAHPQPAACKTLGPLNPRHRKPQRQHPQRHPQEADFFEGEGLALNN